MTNTTNPKSLKELLARAQALGCEVERGGKHIKVRFEGVLLATLATTTSDHRSLLNAVSYLRRGNAGLSVDVRRMIVTRDGVVV